MANADLTQLFAAVAAAAALLSAYFGGRLALNDARRMRRKAPVIERYILPDRLQPDWQSVGITVRNLESVSACVTSVRARNRKVRFCERLEMDGPLDLGRAVRKLRLNQFVQPQGTGGGVLPGGPVAKFFISTYGLSDASQLVFTTEWLDGLK